ncbi:MAG: beta-galactosidase, partial [Candidatus Saccharimonadales bacterium]
TVGSLYGIARWYIAVHANDPLNLGVTFIPDYAAGLGLDPKDTMKHLINDLQVKNFRLVGYWDDIEPQPNKFDFSQLDWQFAMANAAGAKVSLAIGLRQPRWPECHAPDWVQVDSTPEASWYPNLQAFIAAVIGRYKDNPALDSYQLENEYFLSVFGKCTNFDRNRLETEFKFVKGLDATHPVIISRSNNAIGLPVGQPTPDEFGVSVYKRVWDKTITHRYFEYPFPAWFYAFLAGAGQILTGKNMIIHELQAEPWPPHGIQLDTPAELNKSLDAKRLADRFAYGEATGMKTIDLWGAEYWYYRKVKLGDDSLWKVAQQEFAKANKTAIN